MNPYGCHNQPRPVAGAPTHMAQNGWVNGRLQANPTRGPKYVAIRHVMSTTCQYDKRTGDPRCNGCHQIQEQTA